MQGLAVLIEATAHTSADLLAFFDRWLQLKVTSFMMKIQHPRIEQCVSQTYDKIRLHSIITLLEEYNTLHIVMKENGLYAAVHTEEEIESGYDNCWVRDTIHISNYQRERGQAASAEKTLRTLCSYFGRHKHRFIDIIEGRADAQDPMQRPHIRFNGNTLEELDETWSHAQNDALGYACWLTFKMANEGLYEPDGADHTVYSLFPHYFRKIEYWQDADSGHWEEERRINSSSIGAVVAAMEEMKIHVIANPEWLRGDPGRAITVAELDFLINAGRKKLIEQLPAESLPERLADAATLFLIYPLEVVSEQAADAILATVKNSLQGSYGIKRYEGDSYWCADYKTLFDKEMLTADMSNEMEVRNALLKPGTEAQWCLFDPVISVIYGRRYLAGGNTVDLSLQTAYLNRSLAQLSPADCKQGEMQCPESYYLENSNRGRYVPNDQTPLLWTQANLGTALIYMQRSVEKSLSG